MYTEFAIAGLDTNGDGIYSEEELRPLAQTNVEALKEFEWFTFAFLGKDKLQMKEPPADYRLEHKNKLLTLYFTVPLATPVPHAKIKDFSFAIYDPGMYVSLTFAKKAPVKIASAKQLRCEARVGGRPSGDEDGGRLAGRGYRSGEQSRFAIRRARHDRLQIIRFGGKIWPKGARHTEYRIKEHARGQDDTSQPVKACVFDAYGTLFDVHAPAAALASELGERGPAISAQWRAKQLEYTWLRSLMGRYADFAQVTADALDKVLAANGLSASPVRDKLLRSTPRLPPIRTPPLAFRR